MGVTTSRKFYDHLNVLFIHSGAKSSGLIHLVPSLHCQAGKEKKCKNISSNLISNLSSQKRSNEYLGKLNHFAVLFPKQNKVKVRKELHITCKYAVAKVLKVA